MLRTYGPDCDGSLIEATHATQIAPGATWIDLEEPTREEESLVERALGLNVPTREEMKEIEPSSRLFERGEAIYMTLSTLYGIDEGHPAVEPIAFVLAGNRLVTVRYASPKPFRVFADHVRREPELARDALTVLVRLLDTIIDRLADELENSGSEIERISSQIFNRDPGRSRRIPAARLEALLTRIGRAQSLLARIRETAVSSSRVIGFLAASSRLAHAVRCPDKADPKLLAMLERWDFKKAAALLANKMARIIWALMVCGGTYQDNHTPAACAVSA